MKVVKCNHEKCEVKESCKHSVPHVWNFEECNVMCDEARVCDTINECLDVPETGDC